MSDAPHRPRPIVALLTAGVAVWFLLTPYPSLPDGLVVLQGPDPAMEAWIAQVAAAEWELQRWLGLSRTLAALGLLAGAVFAWRGRVGWPLLAAAIGVYAHATATHLLPDVYATRVNVASVALEARHADDVLTVFAAMGRAAGEARYDSQLWSLWATVLAGVALMSLVRRRTP